MSKKKKYKVYVHIFPNGKRYYGYTSRKSINERFNKEGNGYKTQPLMWNAIQKYGWDNIEHKIIKEFNTESEALEYETKMIEKYDTTNPQHGYNIIKSSADLFNQRYVCYTSLYSLENFSDLKSCGLPNHNDYDLLHDYYTSNIFHQINCNLNIYHKFCSTEYAGIIYLEIESDETRYILPEEFKKIKKNKDVIFKCMCIYGIDKKDLDYEVIKNDKFGYRIKILYSLYDGKYYIFDENKLTERDINKVEKVLNLIMDAEKNLHKEYISCFEGFKQYIDGEDFQILKSFDKNTINQMRKFIGMKASLHSKLQEDDVIEILKMLSNGISGCTIARKFNVKQNTISKIKNKQTWGYMYEKYPELYTWL